MSIEFVTDANRVSFEKWRDTVWKHPQGNVFQTPYMHRVYSEAEGVEPISTFLMQKDEIVALMQGALQYFASGLARRNVVTGGPLVVSEQTDAMLSAFLNEYDAWVRNDVIYTQIRNSFATTDVQPIFSENEFDYEDHLNIVVDLTRSEDTLWQDVHSKRRNEIRRAYKEGTTVEEVTSRDDLLECYAILQEVYEQARLPLPHESLFLSAWEQSEDSVGLKVFAAVNEKKIIGTMFTLYFRDCLYDWYAGSYRVHYKKYPNDLLPWEIFLWGKRNGFRVFDFGGAGKPGVPYGVRDFKKKFGGTLVNFGRYRKVHQPLKMRLAEYGFKTWRYLKRYQIGAR